MTKRKINFLERANARNRNASSPNQLNYNIPTDHLRIPADEFDTTLPINTQRLQIQRDIIDRLQGVTKPSDIISSRPKTPGYRFYNPEMYGLESLAEQRGQQSLPKNIREEFLSGHAGANKKEISEGGTSYYSPFTSLTQSLPDFINTSFKPQGDINIRHAVLNRSPRLGAFDIPNSHVVNPTTTAENPDHDLPQQEKEFLFESKPTAGGLSTYMREGTDNIRRDIANPFKNRININFPKMLASKGFMNYPAFSERVTQHGINEKNFNENETLPAQDNYNYRRHLRDGERLQNDILEYKPYFENPHYNADNNNYNPYGPPPPGASSVSSSSLGGNIASSNQPPSEFFRGGFVKKRKPKKLGLSSFSG